MATPPGWTVAVPPPPTHTQTHTPQPKFCCSVVHARCRYHPRSDGEIAAADAEAPLIVLDEGLVVVVVDESGWAHGQVQPKACRDWFWGVLFLAQFAVVVTLAVMGVVNLVREGSRWSPFNDYDDDDGSPSNPTDDGSHNGGGGDANLINGAGLWFFLTITGSVVAISSLLMHCLLGALSPMMIQISLVASPVCFGLIFVAAMIVFNLPLAFFSLFASAIGVFYAWGVWHRIPFASANIDLAMRALGDNHGLWVLAYAMTLKAVLWTLLWTCTFLQVFAFSHGWVYECDDEGRTDDASAPPSCRLSARGKCIAVGLFLSLFWTAEVLKNLFHTTIAGVVGTWWFAPDEARSSSAGAGGTGGRSCSCCRTWCGCSPAIYDSWVRSCVYSFGSICLGSLLVGLMRVVQLIVRCGRQQREQSRDPSQGGSLCLCLLQCVVDYLEYLLEYINQWSFVYVGLYGYDYWTAGKQVTTLLKQRGWSVIVNDQLVSRSLSMMSTLIGVVTGVIGVMVGFFFLGPLGSAYSFFVGLILGMLSCNILFGVVTSAVNTIVVCFAESPNQLRLNHPPELYQKLTQAWRAAYPDDCGF